MKFTRRSTLNRVLLGKRTPFDYINITVMIILCFITLYPFWYMIILSLNEGLDASMGPIWFWPREFTLTNYKFVFGNNNIGHAFLVTIARSVAAPIFSVTVCMLAGFSLSKRFLKGRKFFIFFYMIPMFIGGTIITRYIVIAKAGLMNTFLLYVLVHSVSFFSIIVMRTFIDGIPESLEESAMIDGADYFKVFARIIAPLSKPVIAAFLFFGAVNSWLDFSTTLFFITEKKLYTLQYLLYLLIKSRASDIFVDVMSGNIASNLTRSDMPTEQVLKAATLVLVTFPLLFIYPFFQKYFIKGMYVGSVKA